jgi:hypothetical protein
MLTYSRIKSVGVQLQGPEKYVVTGVLEDELYAMECAITLTRSDLRIQSVKARMKRFTTTRCLPAQNTFKKLEGFAVGPELESKIKKELGPDGCRHMAGLIVDCCRAVLKAEIANEFKRRIENGERPDATALMEHFGQKYPNIGALITKVI